MEGAKVYVQDSKGAWQKATVSAALGAGKYQVRLQRWEDASHTVEDTDVADGEELEVNAANLEGNTLPFQNADMPVNGFPNMTTLDHLHEAALLHNLRVRFFAGNCSYTYTADIVIALNPYRWFPDLYTDEKQKEYLVYERAKLPPHVYATSAAAYSGLQETHQDQAILVSGESGAGKTETVKILMRHLALIASSDDSTHIRRIVESNPLLESFGNAQTIRNDNSSRFGKFIELQLDNHSRLSGSRCRTYLLEKSRVVGQDAGERNYHIFYQMLAASPESRASFGLGAETRTRDRMKYTCLGNSATDTIEGKSDGAKFEDTISALALVGVDGPLLRQLWRSLAGVLLLGQVEFDGGSSQDAEATFSAAARGDAAETADVWEVDLSELEKAMTHRTIRTRNEEIVKPLTPAAAAVTRDALAKELYSRVFDWLVGKICDATAAPEGEASQFVGLLDIFGFESFAINRFEQLCINYANEKLQQKFTSDVFKAVQQEYSEEGIPWEKIEFKDNASVLALIESKLGIIAMLNEECVRPKGSEENFVAKLTTVHKEHPNYSVPKVGKEKELQFAIQHYAGSVMYTATGWLERNKDTISDDVISLMRKSSNAIIASVFAPPEVADGKAEGENGEKKVTKAGADTVATKFKTSLVQLMDTIGKTSTQYVRCIKPNKNKSPVEVDNQMVVEQLRCAGVIEAIRISRAGFPARMPLGEFAQRFGVLARFGLRKEAAKNEDTAKALAAMAGSDDIVKCRALMEALAPGDLDKYEIGRTRVYFKSGVLESLEERRALLLQAAATRITRQVRGGFVRRNYLRQRRIILYVQAVARMRRIRIDFLRKRHAIIVCQSRRRAVYAKRVYAELKRNHCAVRLQAAWRRHVAVRDFANVKRAVIRIQARVRCRAARQQYLRDLVEKKEQAKLENQVKALQARLAAAEAAGAAAQPANAEPPAEILEALQALAQENAKLRVELEKVKTENTALRQENQQLRAGQSRRSDWMTSIIRSVHHSSSHEEAHPPIHVTPPTPSQQQQQLQQSNGQVVLASQGSPPPKRGVAEAMASMAMGSKRQSMQSMRDKLSDHLSAAKERLSASTPKTPDVGLSSNYTPEKRSGDFSPNGRQEAEQKQYAPLNEFWEDVPCADIPLLRDGTEVHIKFGHQILLVAENGKSLVGQSWMMFSRGYRRSMSFILERKIDRKSSASRRGSGQPFSLLDDDSPEDNEDNSLGEAFVLRSELTKRYVVIGGLFDFYRMQVTAERPEEATVFSIIALEGKGGLAGGGAPGSPTLSFAFRAHGENKVLSLRKDGYVGMETVPDVDTAVFSDRMAAAMEFLKPMASYEITCDEKQVGIAVGRELPLRVVGFNTAKEMGRCAEPGPAERTGRCKIGDFITSVNGQRVDGISRNDVIGMIGSKRPVTLGFTVDIDGRCDVTLLPADALGSSPVPSLSPSPQDYATARSSAASPGALVGWE